MRFEDEENFEPRLNLIYDEGIIIRIEIRVVFKGIYVRFLNDKLVLLRIQCILFEFVCCNRKVKKKPIKLSNDNYFPFYLRIKFLKIFTV